MTYQRGQPWAVCFRFRHFRFVFQELRWKKGAEWSQWKGPPWSCCASPQFCSQERTKTGSEPVAQTEAKIRLKNFKIFKFGLGWVRFIRYRRKCVLRKIEDIHYISMIFKKFSKKNSKNFRKKFQTFSTNQIVRF